MCLRLTVTEVTFSDGYVGGCRSRRGCDCWWRCVGRRDVVHACLIHSTTSLLASSVCPRPSRYCSVGVRTAHGPMTSRLGAVRARRPTRRSRDQLGDKPPRQNCDRQWTGFCRHRLHLDNACMSDRFSNDLPEDFSRLKPIVN